MSTPAHTDCGCDTPKGLLSVESARTRILDLVTPVTGVTRVAIRAALGRALAADIRSDIAVPPCDNSAMDGYALNSADLPASGEATLTIAGTVFAGAPLDIIVKRGHCARIMTGAMIPAGTDTVIMQERVKRDGDRITIGAGHRLGENVRHAGEDVAVGDTVLHAGKRIMPVELGLLASLGIAEVDVYRLPRVAFFSTGDELRGVGQSLGPGQIHDSNRYTLHGMLTRIGVSLIDMGSLPDDRARIHAAFSAAARDADMVITSGGVSVGEADYVKETLDELGQVDFWKIAMKPGKPLACGRIGDALFFGLPGNPVSVMATFYQFVQPALLKLRGEPATPPLVIRVPCRTALKKQPGRTDFQRGILERSADGCFVVHTTGLQGSHVLTSMSRANCFIILPAESADVEPGTLVDVQPFSGLV